MSTSTAELNKSLAETDDDFSEPLTFSIQTKEMIQKEIESLLTLPLKYIIGTFASTEEIPHAILALSAIISSNAVSKAEKEFFEQKQVWECIRLVREILARPSSLVGSNTVFNWGSDFTQEAEGTVVNTIRELINTEIAKLKKVLNVHTYILLPIADAAVTLKLLFNHGAICVERQRSLDTLMVKVEIPSHKLDKTLREKVGMHRVAVQKSKLTDTQLKELRDLPLATIEEEITQPGKAPRWLITASKKAFTAIENIINPPTTTLKEQPVKKQDISSGHPVTHNTVNNNARTAEEAHSSCSLATPPDEEYKTPPIVLLSSATSSQTAKAKQDAANIVPSDKEKGLATLHVRKASVDMSH